MNEKTRSIIKNDPILYRFLREESYYYKDIYRNSESLKTIKEKAKEKYKLRSIDKVEKIKNTMDLINTFISVID